jgi:hypothetical protein
MCMWNPCCDPVARCLRDKRCCALLGLKLIVPPDKCYCCYEWMKMPTFFSNVRATSSTPLPSLRAPFLSLNSLRAQRAGTARIIASVLTRAASR